MAILFIFRFNFDFIAAIRLLLIENKNIRNRLQLLRIPYIKPLVRKV
nr:MAG TPA: hypothetical protein [Bacteriophage sp.]